MSDEERIKRIEEAMLLMKDLVVRHEDGLDSHEVGLDSHAGKLDDYYKALKESREEFEFKMNALVDSQIRTEAEIIELRKTSESHLTRIEKIEGSLEK